MKQILCFLLYFFLLGTVSGQMVKKISIGELESYINSSPRPLVVNFWATFCKPCIEELPYFLSAAEKHDSVELVLVSLDLPDYYPAKVETFLKTRQFTNATLFWLDETNADTFCPRIDPGWEGAIPVTLWVDNSKAYRKFVNRPMTEAQIRLAFTELTK